MIRGLYTATSGMLANQRKQEALTNNLANINTPGYKADQTVYRTFPELLIQRINDGSTPQVPGVPSFPANPALVGRINTGVYAQELIPLFSQGDIVETGKELDVALTDSEIAPIDVNGRPVQPKLFFTVQKGNGDLSYTRNGNWTLDNQGRLATSDGDLILDRQGNPINLTNLLVDQNGQAIPLTRETVQIREDGTLAIIQGTDNNSQPLQQQIELGLVQADNPYQMVKEGQSTYRWAGDQPLQAPPGTTPYQVRQGFIERSNVNPSQTITDMMLVVRSYEANQKVIQSYDTTLQKLWEVARV